MTFRMLSFGFVLIAAAGASCSAAMDDDSLAQDEPGALGDEDGLASSSQSLMKGAIGAVNGDLDYCADPQNLCVSGEGDCDSRAQCTGGATCLSNNGNKYGFPANWDVCAPAHCGNKILDAGLGESGVDCGGPCGQCLANCAGTAGDKDFCRSCICVSGAGDCDADSECQPGLVCAPNNGPLFGMAAQFDVCVPPNCVNGVQDGASGETGVDVGGPCGVEGSACLGTPGTTNFCQGCKCNAGQGDCDANVECASGLVCGQDNGVKFGFGGSFDICVAPHCTNGVRDSGQGETGIDVGGPCGSVGSVPPSDPILYFSEYVEGSGGNRALEITNAGGLASGCAVRYYLSGSSSPAFVFGLADIAANATFTVCHSTAAIGTPPCDQLTTLGFNGDDAIELYCGTTTHDVIGQIGFDPGLQWGTGAASTQDNTMRRKCSVSAGDTTRTDTFDPAAEWDGALLDDFSGLGSRGCL